MHILIFANGEPNDGPMVRRALAEAQDAYVIAADGGARVARYFECPPHLVIGDMDSLSEEEVQRLASEGAEIQRYPQEKDETDLELALRWAADHQASWVRIIGGLGGRFDQMLANVYLMGVADFVSADVKLVAGKQAIELLSPGDNLIKGTKGDTISLLPVGGRVTGIRTENLQYPLRYETLEFGPARGISNVMTDDVVHIHIAEGTLLLVHTIGRA